MQNQIKQFVNNFQHLIENRSNSVCSAYFTIYIQTMGLD